jgi:hypothetical protein
MSTKFDQATPERIALVNRHYAAAGQLDVHIDAAARNCFVDDEGVRHALFNLMAIDLVSLGHSVDDLCEDVRKARLVNEGPRSRGRWDDQDE